MTAMILIRLQAGKEGSALSEIKKIEGIKKVETVFGRWDLIVTVDPKKLIDSIKTGIEFRKRQLSDSSLSEEQRVYLNAELLALQEKLANFPETISERVADLLSSIKGLESLHGTLPESQIKTAQIALTKNNTEEAIIL